MRTRSSSFYPYLGVPRQARITFSINLHAGREQYKPALPEYFNESAEVDFENNNFSDAFTDILIRLLRTNKISQSREEAKLCLQEFADRYMPSIET